MDACQIFNRDLCYIHCWSMFQRSQITSADFWTAPTHLTYGRGMFNVPQHFFILVTNMTKNSECITLVSCINLVKQGCTFSFDYSFIAILSCVFYSGNDIDLASLLFHTFQDLILSVHECPRSVHECPRSWEYHLPMLTKWFVSFTFAVSLNNI